jgi:histone H3/H4
MKLFTIFTSDGRAVDHMLHDRKRIDRLLARVRGHHEWGVRVLLDRSPSQSVRPSVSRARHSESGLEYLRRKKVQRDAAAELAERAQETVAGLYDRLAAGARAAKRRAVSELPVKNAPLLLDAAFLVPASKAARFRASAAREARGLARHGYRVTLTGPWPPYSFIQE